MIDAPRLPPVFDTHTHLDDPAFDLDRDTVIAAARAVGVQHFLNIGYEPDRWESSHALRERYEEIEFALGLHPQLADRYETSLARDLKRAVEVLVPVAIGETGFDLSRSTPSFPEQERAFRGQLEIAAAYRLPTVIHQRNASDALMIELDRWPDVAPIVLHSFDGTQRLADWARNRGCFVGIGGLATKRASESLRETLTRMTTDRLLLETDSPYLAPPGSPSRRNDPTNLPRIADALAPLWGLSGEDLCWLTSRNAAGLFGFPAVDSARTTAILAKHDDPPTARRDLESREASRDPRSPSKQDRDRQS